MQEVVPNGFSFNGSRGLIDGLVSGQRPKHAFGISKVLVHKFCFWPLTQTHRHAASVFVEKITCIQDIKKTTKNTIYNFFKKNYWGW